MELKYVGKSIPRVDGFAKVTGTAKYAGDIKIPGMLYGSLLHSTIPHGNIINIDTTRALALPGVSVVLTYKNVPQIKFTTCGHPLPIDTPLDSLILGQRVRYYGEPIAAVAAESQEIAQEALGLIDVEYEEWPAYFTPEEASAEGAVEIHPGQGPGNISGSHSINMGDVDAAFEKADYIFEEEFNTPIVSHAPIENYCSLCELDEHNDLVVYSANQSPHILRRILSEAFGLPIGKIRVVRKFIGGGFGGKQEPVQEPINAALTLAARRPVKLEYTREETMSATRTRHSMKFIFKTGVSKDGTFTARELKVISNTGAYSGHGHNVCGNIGGQFVDFYPCEHMRFQATTYYTNITVASAMRGYGIPQLCFATEAHIDNIAYKLGMDPLYIRGKNFHKEGYVSDKLVIRSYALPQISETGRLMTGWDEKRKKYGNRRQSENKARGIGAAFFSYKQTTYNHGVELSSARIIVNEDGTVILNLGASEVGQGSDTALTQIAAEALGLPVESFKVPQVDTGYSPFDLGAYASRQTYLSGIAVKKAALSCKADLLALAAAEYRRDADRMDISDGNFVDKDTGKIIGAVSEVTIKTYYNMEHPRTIVHEAWANPDVNAQSTGATFAEVEVDLKTGAVQVLRLLAVMDSGRIINPLLAESQVLGGHVMSYGYGLTEQILIDERTGRVLNDNLLDYKIPTMADTPATSVTFIETNEPSSAYGNKGIGEPANIPPAAAIRNAVFHALNIEPNEFINRIPLTPDRVLNAISEFQAKSQTELQSGVPRLDTEKGCGYRNDV